MLTLGKLATVSTVTSWSGLRLIGQRSKKGQISNAVKFQNRWCQTVGLGQTCQSLHSYLFVRPMIKGWKVINGQILNKIKWFYFAYMLAVEKHAKFFTVTSLSNIPLWGKRSKNMDNFKQRQIANSTRSKVKH